MGKTELVLGDLIIGDLHSYWVIWAHYLHFTNFHDLLYLRKKWDRF
jgi:hypothetical protein